MSQRTSILASVIRITIGVLIFVSGFIIYDYFHKVDIGEQVVSIIIEPGDGFNLVAQKLLAQGVVDSKLMLKYPARLMDIDKKLIPGRYDFTGENSCRSVLAKLSRGEFLKKRITIYEGAPIWKVASALQRELDIDSAVVMALNTDSAMLAELAIPSLEGYLFPETYFFKWGIGAREVIGEMVQMYHRQTEGIWPDSLPLGLSREEVMILASIVEAEARLDREKPIIASVYQNRLRKKMRLDADPTVIYGLGGLDRPLWKKDIQKETPYNTYRKKGLPPTPINSPGLAAIRATFNPESTDYLFFVADGTGGHRFSRTNAEHNRARYEIKQETGNSTN